MVTMAAAVPQARYINRPEYGAGTGAVNVAAASGEIIPAQQLMQAANIISPVAQATAAHVTRTTHAASYPVYQSSGQQTMAYIPGAIQGQTMSGQAETQTAAVPYQQTQTTEQYPTSSYSTSGATAVPVTGQWTASQQDTTVAIGSMAYQTPPQEQAQAQATCFVWPMPGSGQVAQTFTRTDVHPLHHHHHHHQHQQHQQSSQQQPEHQQPQQQQQQPQQPHQQQLMSQQQQQQQQHADVSASSVVTGGGLGTAESVGQLAQSTIASPLVAPLVNSPEQQHSPAGEKLFEESLVKRRHLAQPSESDRSQKLSDASEVMSPQRYSLAHVSAIYHQHHQQQPAQHTSTTQPSPMRTYFQGYTPTPVYGSSTPVVPVANPAQQHQVSVYPLASQQTAGAVQTLHAVPTAPGYRHATTASGAMQQATGLNPVTTTTCYHPAPYLITPNTPPYQVRDVRVSPTSPLVQSDTYAATGTMPLQHQHAHHHQLHQHQPHQHPHAQGMRMHTLDSGRPRRRKSQPVDDGDPGRKIFIWDLDETLLLYSSLLDGSFAKTMDLDCHRMDHLGRTLEKLIFALSDSSFFLKDLEKSDQCHIEDVVQDGTVVDLRDYDFANDGFTPTSPEASGEMEAAVQQQWYRQLANRYLQIQNTWSRARTTALTDLLPMDQVKENEQLQQELDQNAESWHRTVLRCLALISSRSNCSNVVVSSCHFVPTLSKLLLYGMAPHFPLSGVYGSASCGKEACIERIKARFGGKCTYLVIGNGGEEEAASRKLDLIFWPIRKVSDHQALLQALSLEHM
ncbi:eyes absent homolog 3-like isoform X2 [Sycon ciliatum]